MDFRNGEAEEMVETKGPKKETLEQLLLARNKKLGSELTVLRVCRFHMMAEHLANKNL